MTRYEPTAIKPTFADKAVVSVAVVSYLAGLRALAVRLMAWQFRRMVKRGVVQVFYREDGT